MTTYFVRNFSRLVVRSKAFHPQCSGLKYLSDDAARSTCGPTTNSSSESKEQADKEYEDGINKQILESSLVYVNLHGWSKESITAGAEALGYPGVIHGMFPRGGIELVEFFYKLSNQTLVTRMAQEFTKAEGEKKSTKLFITDAIEYRLRMIIPYINRWPEALGMMTLPANIPTALANLLTLVDDICYYSGDKDVDVKWYARRIALAGIYKTTELYMLQDSSKDYAHTWEFLSRRMEEAQQMNRFLLQTEQTSQLAKDFASATFITARNILGITWNR